MATPFQFDIYGAPPADPSAGFAAFSQGMGNAAQLMAQTGQQFAALRQVAQDYQRFNQEKELQERSLGARAAYEKALLAQRKAETDQEFGFKTEAAANERRRVAALEWGLRLRAVKDAEDAEIARMQAATAAAAEARLLEEQRLRAIRDAAIGATAQYHAWLGGQKTEEKLGGIKDPTVRGMTEAQGRALFRGMGRGFGDQSQGSGPMQQIAPGVQMPSVAPGRQVQAVPHGDKRAMRDALAEQVARRANAEGWSYEQAQVELARLYKAAGID